MWPIWVVIERMPLWPAARPQFHPDFPRQQINLVIDDDDLFRPMLRKDGCPPLA
jgi:hypothetical protein